MEYRSILGRGADDFDKKAAAAIADGWVPFGGISISTIKLDNGQIVAMLAQGMTRGAD